MHQFSFPAKFSGKFTWHDLPSNSVYLLNLAGKLTSFPCIDSGWLVNLVETFMSRDLQIQVPPKFRGKFTSPDLCTNSGSLLNLAWNRTSATINSKAFIGNPVVSTNLPPPSIFLGLFCSSVDTLVPIELLKVTYSYIFLISFTDLELIPLKMYVWDPLLERLEGLEKQRRKVKDTLLTNGWFQYWEERKKKSLEWSFLLPESRSSSRTILESAGKRLFSFSLPHLSFFFFYLGFRFSGKNACCALSLPQEKKFQQLELKNSLHAKSLIWYVLQFKSSEINISL